MRIIHRAMPIRNTSHLAVVIRAGTRDERASEEGMAHFLEHMLFKGTQKRSPFQVLNRLESIGGDLNAYTTKEFICIYGSFLNIHLERAIELFADILIRPSFPEKEIGLERKVVLDEIMNYEDDFNESIYDDFEHEMFKGHGLGYYILGKPKTVQTFDQHKLLKFYKRLFTADNMVVAYSGSNHQEKVVDLVGKHFAELKSKKRSGIRKPLTSTRTFNLEVPKRAMQSYCCIGAPAYGIQNEKRFALHLLNNLLCGSNLNSKLNMSLREKMGWVYSVGSDYVTYMETGCFSIQFSSAPKLMNKVISKVKENLSELVFKEISINAMSQIKRQLVNRIIMGEDHGMNKILNLSKSVLDFNKLPDTQKAIENISSLTQKDLQAVAKDIFHKENLSQIIYHAS